MTRADENLLFGVHAWQCGAVTESELLEAIKAWTFSKESSLATILEETGILDAPQVALVRRMVDAHLELHDHDPARVVASLALSESVAASLSDVDDDELQSSLTMLPAAPPLPASLPIPTLPPPIDLVSASQARFRILRPHARGGLGEVFLAHDTELNREVAVKLILEERSGNVEAQDRFRLEAEITGGLEHPGIVPVYSLGKNADGQPYYAMRFVRGENLKDAIRRFHERGPDDPDSNLAFRELLGRFIDVCNSIEYAHSRGVLHRDLKPNNVMLGRFGETLVVDWGLARATGQSEAPPMAESMAPIEPTSGSDLTPTRAGSVIGTLQYMSPEQALGKVDELGPPTDVYSMGCILYEILTNRPPIDRVLNDEGHLDLGATIRRIAEGRVTFPTETPVHAVKPLRAICLKALAREAGDRYASVAALAGDVERWLADEPVSVHRESWLKKTSRWLRRYRTFTTAAASVAVVAFAGLLVFSTLLGKKNRELTRLNGTLDRKNVELRQANTEAAGARRVAEANEQIAREQSELALSTLTDIVGSLHDELEKLSGSGPVRNRILQTAVERLEKIADGLVSESQAQTTTVQSLLKLGESVLDLTPPALATESQTALAEKLFDRAEQIARAMYEEEQNDDTIELLTDCLDTLSSVSHRSGRLADAIRHATAALTLRKELDGVPDDPLWKERRLSISHQRLANLHLEAGDPDVAFSHMGEFERICREIAEKQPDQVLSQYYLSIALNAHADGLHQSLKPQLALRKYLEAEETLRGCLDKVPSHVDYRRQLAVVRERIAQVHYDARRLEQAQEVAEAALAGMTRLAQENPDDDQLQRSATVAANLVAKVLVAKGEVREALPLYQLALETRVRLAESDPDSAIAARDVILSLTNVGRVRLTLNELTGAAEAYESAVAKAADLTDRFPGYVLGWQARKIALESLGNMKETTGDHAGAASTFEEELAIDTRIASADPAAALHRSSRAIILAKLGQSRTGAGQLEEAGVALEEAELIQEQLLAENDSVLARRSLSITKERLASLRIASGDSVEAVELQAACARLRWECARTTQAPTSALEAVYASQKHARYVRTAGDSAEAIRIEQDCLEGLAQIAAKNPNHTRLWRRVFTERLRVANSLEKARRFTDAEEAYQRAIECLGLMEESGVEVTEAERELRPALLGAVERVRIFPKALQPLPDLLMAPAADVPYLNPSLYAVVRGWEP